MYTQRGKHNTHKVEEWQGRRKMLDHSSRDDWLQTVGHIVRAHIACQWFTSWEFKVQFRQTSCDDGDGLFVWVRAGGAFKSSKVKLWKGEKLHENPLCMLEFIVANSENLPIFAILMHESNRQRQIKSFTLVWPNEPNDRRKQVCFLKLICERTKHY